MPYDIDEIDIAILNSLMEDGRKSFRQIAREIKVTTPTVKTRYQRLVNLGFLKSISPVLDMSKLNKKNKKQIKQPQQKIVKLNLDASQNIKVTCDYCDGPVLGRPTLLKFSKYERFFCCISCKSLYKEKYGGRINSLIKSKE